MYWVFMGIYILQRIPPIVLVFFIVLRGSCSGKQGGDDQNGGINADNLQPEGPTLASKIILIIAAVLHGFNDLPYGTLSFLPILCHSPAAVLFQISGRIS